MPPRSPIARLTDIVEARKRVRSLLRNVPLKSFETDWLNQWVVERGIEIISEASHLPADMKSRHDAIPWRKVAGIGNAFATTTNMFPPASSGRLSAKSYLCSKKSAAPSWTLRSLANSPKPDPMLAVDPVKFIGAMRLQIHPEVRGRHPFATPGVAKPLHSSGLCSRADLRAYASVCACGGRYGPCTRTTTADSVVE